MLTKTRVIRHFGSVAKVAQFFGIHVQAVYQWETYVPRERELELIIGLPQVFGTPEQRGLAPNDEGKAVA